MKSSLGRLKVLSIFILGGVLGSIIGASTALKYSNSKQITYSKGLEDYYIDSRLFHLSLAVMTFKKAEEAHAEKIQLDKATEVRGLFHSIIELHKTGQYKDKEKQITKTLQDAHSFILERPAYFIDQAYDSDASTKEMRNQLQSDLDYAVSLLSK